jgi:hypothetical protein
MGLESVGLKSSTKALKTLTGLGKAESMLATHRPSWFMPPMFRGVLRCVQLVSTSPPLLAAVSVHVLLRRCGQEETVDFPCR